MHVLKKYKAVLLSGLLVVVFCVAAYCAVGRADSADSQYTYAEHIFQDDTVNEINIEIDEADWQDMLENPLEEEYHKANITINGETVGNVAIRTKGNNSLGQRTAENLKKNVACCPQKADFNETMEIKGRSLLTGLPVRVNVSTADLYEPVMRLSEQIGTAAHQVLEKTPPELAGDIYRNGVVLTGGGAQLHGLPEYLSQELKVEVTVSPDPVNCVALGTAMSLRLGDKLETGFMDATPRMGRR